MTRLLKLPLSLACGSATAAALGSMPKCPTCLTAYATTYLVAAAGLGLTFAAATYLRNARMAKHEPAETREARKM